MKYEDVFRTIYPAFCKLGGRDTYAALRAREGCDTLNHEQIRALQLRKLRKVLISAFDNVPFYKDAFRGIGFNPRELNSIGQFEALNFSITKSDIRDSTARFISDSARPSDLVWHKTGGSTGVPLDFPTDKSTDAANATAFIRALSRWEVEFGARHAQFWGSPTFIERGRSDRIKTILNTIKNRLMNRLFILNYNIGEKNAHAICDALIRFKPEYIKAMPSSVYHFAKIMNKAGRFLESPPKVIISACEQLYEWQKGEIEKFFRCPVANSYGLSEAGDVAYEAPCGHLHLVEDDMFVELGSKCGGGREIIISQLNNFSSPLIKYRTQDVAGAIRSVSCKYPGRVLHDLQGRAHDVIVAPNGQVVHGQMLTHLIVFEKGISKYQVVQEPDYSFSISLVTTSEYDEDSESRIVKGLRKYVDPAVAVRFSYVDEIPLTPRGKHRWIISHVNRERSNAE